MTMYFHCAMHCLNLSASRTISIPAIQQAQAVIKNISACFRSSAKRTDLLKSCINQDDNAKKSKNHLTSLCETRFVERHTAVLTLKVLLKYVVQALDEMKLWQSAEAEKTAFTLEASVW